MTAFALRTAATLVCIVLGVTAVAVRRHVVEMPFDMAADARVFPVLADEREIGRVVIELYFRPPDR